MTRTSWIWALLTVVYLAFFSWYTSFAGPLNETEIEHYMDLIQQNQDPRDPELAAQYGLE